MNYKAKPFLKWVGGKRQLLTQFFEYYPESLRNRTIQNYVEPFLGGGAVFFELYQKYDFKNVYLSDLNQDLIAAYQVVQQKPNLLLEWLYHYQKKYDQTEQPKRNELFLNIRNEFNERRFDIKTKKLDENWVLRTAQLIFLNKTCFNGLYRLNSKGAFNVSYGKYKKAVILDAPNILAVSKVLENVEICHADYSACWDKIDAHTFVYFDPPYRPLNATSSFTTYTGLEFGETHQLKLADFFRKLDKEKNAKLMLSNSDPTNENPNDNFFEKAYYGYSIAKISAGRVVNSNGKKRGKITELLITNYKHEP